MVKREVNQDETAVREGEGVESRKGKLAFRILIAHTGSNLQTSDVREIVRHVWDGQIDPSVKTTSNPLTDSAWSGDEQFATAWLMWQQMLQHRYGEHPYWEDHKTYAYRGTIPRTQQRFYIEVYYKD
jgi:hypothetical protein